MRPTLLAAFVVITVQVNFGASSHLYHEFEEKFWSVEENLDKLHDTFYPTNMASPNFIFVDYSCINESNDTVVTCTLNKDNTFGYTKFPHKLKEHCEEEHNVSHLCNWMWTDSAVYLVYSPAVLNTLAYFTESFFAIRYYYMIQLHIPILCHEVTKDHIKKLTTRLKSVASAKDTGVIKAYKDRGYAVQVISRNSNIVKSVLGTLFHYFIRVSVYLINAMAALYAIPYLLNVTTWAYPLVYSSVMVSPMWYAIAWAAAIVGTILNVVIIVLNFWMVILPNCDFSFGVNVAYFIVMFLVELVTAFLVPMKNDINIPRFLQFCACGCHCGNIRKLNLLIQKLAVWSVLVFVQLLIEHTIFMIMAFIYHPFTTAGMFIAYTLCISCITLFIAIIILSEELIFCTIKRNIYTPTDILLCIVDLAKTIYVLMIFLCIFVVLVGGAFMEKQKDGGGLTSSSLNTSLLIGLIGYIVAYYIKSTIKKR